MARRVVSSHDRLGEPLSQARSSAPPLSGFLAGGRSMKGACHVQALHGRSNMCSGSILSWLVTSPTGPAGPKESRERRRPVHGSACRQQQCRPFGHHNWENLGATPIQRKTTFHLAPSGSFREGGRLAGLARNRTEEAAREH